MSRTIPFMDEQDFASGHKYIHDIRRIIDPMPYLRTAISGKSEAFTRQEIKALRNFP